MVIILQEYYNTSYKYQVDKYRVRSTTYVDHTYEP